MQCHLILSLISRLDQVMVNHVFSHNLIYSKYSCMYNFVSAHLGVIMCEVMMFLSFFLSMAHCTIRVTE